MILMKDLSLYVASGSIVGGQIGAQKGGNLGLYLGGIVAGFVSEGALTGIGSIAGGIA